MLPKGQRVTVRNPALMRDFKSKTLDRQFDEVYFGELAEPQAATAAPDPAPLTHASADPPATFDKPLAPAPGGSTIAEIHAQRGALRGKQVVVRGRVVKSTTGVLGKNWLHLQDGTGKAAGSDFDLAVTTQAEVELGATITATGRLATDKDFGTGYSYPVILEDAQISAR